jgi:hypothetical protein
MSSFACRLGFSGERERSIVSVAHCTAGYQYDIVPHKLNFISEFR